MSTITSNALVEHFGATRQILKGLRVPKSVDIEINLLNGLELTISETPPSSLTVSQVGYRSKLHTLGKLLVALVNFTATVLMGISLVVSVVVFGPKLYYSFFPVEPTPVIAQGESLPAVVDDQVAEAYQPEYDPNLPEGDWLVIPRIGVRTNLIKSQYPQEALDQGVWWVPGYGAPGEQTQPMILAAHRYGFKYMWETVLDDGSTYALRNIFYKLPETEPGDRIEIIHEQRRYVYEIYAGEEAHDITDYDADLILYTCKYIDSPVRMIRYAKLIDPTADTQLN